MPELEPGAPTDLELMAGIQAEDPEALSQLYDRYNGIVKALILRIIRNETEADDLLQEVFMEIWNQAKNFSAQKGKPLGWMVTLTRRRSIDALRSPHDPTIASSAAPSSWAWDGRAPAATSNRATSTPAGYRMPRP